MLHEVFSLRCRLAELGALLFSVSSLPRNCWLNEFFCFHLGLLGGEFAVLDVVVRMAE
jgi:hypothetical protein